MLLLLHSLGFPELPESRLPSLYLSKCQHYSKTHPLYSYLCGMYCVQVALKLSTGDPAVDRTLNNLLAYLEETKQKRLPSRLDSSILLRRQFARELNDKFEHLTAVLTLGRNEHAINFGQLVELLLELAILYDVLHGLYPISGFDKQDAEELRLECSDETVEYRIYYCRTQASTILSIIKLGQDPQSYMSQLKMVPLEPEADPADEVEVQKMIQAVMAMPDDELEGANGAEGDDEMAAKNLTLPSVPLKSALDEKSKQERSPAPVSKDPSAALSQPPAVTEGSSAKLPPPTNNNPKFIHEVPRQHTRAEIETIMNNETLLEIAIKDAKHAVSAMNYEDYDTALLKLSEAIRLVKDLKGRSEASAD
jgi:hypothetical protein